MIVIELDYKYFMESSTHNASQFSDVALYSNYNELKN